MGDSSGSKKQLGKIMLQQKLVTPDELTGILEEQGKRGGKLASTATRDGKVTVTDALRALSEQHGVPAIDLRRQIIPLVNLQLIPVEIAREHAVLPVKVQGEQLLLAMATPNNKNSIEEIGFVTAKVVFPHIALDTPLHEVIDAAYALLDRGEKYYIGEFVTDEELLALGIARPDPAPPIAAAELPPTAAAVQDSEAVRVAQAAPLAGDTLLGGAAPEAEMSGVVHGRPPRADGPELDQAFSERPKARASIPVPGLHGKKVLIVEDDADTRRLIRLTLEHAGIACLEAHSGTRALEMIRDDSPDAIVLDAVLPGVHGFDICRRLRGSQRYGTIPIVIVSAIHHGWRVAEDLRAAYGIEHAFDKPIDLPKLTRTVAMLLEGKEVVHDDVALSADAEAELKNGMAAFEQGEIDTAVAHLVAGVAIDPLAFELQYHLGLLYGRREDMFSAIDALETAVRLAPRHFSALKNLAVVYQRAGFRHKAVETWDRAMANAPSEETRMSIKEHMVTLL
jgi:DNA-binding response OmpR family regulator